MAEPKKAVKIQPDEALDFELVTESYDIAGGARRGESGATVESSGRTVLNVEGTNGWDSLVIQAGENVNQCFVTFGAHEATKQVACYVCTQDAEGALPVRKYGTNSVFHLGGVFKKHPKLRPTGKRECGVRVGKDKKGRPCLIITLNNGTIKGTTKRDSTSESESAAK